MAAVPENLVERRKRPSAVFAQTGSGDMRIAQMQDLMRHGALPTRI